MDFEDTRAEAAFRAEVRVWLADNGPRFVPPPGADDADIVALARRWQAALADAGYAGFGFPREIGGRPGPLTEQIIFGQETAEHPMSAVEMMALGCGMAIPTMQHWGSEAQLERLAAPTVRGEVLWCQLFSEPEAGSDLAGIRTRAKPDAEGWVLDGQKVWTTGAEFADWGLLLARTDPAVPKHRGLTYFLLDMRSPGIEVRPLRQLGGRAEFSEVFLNEVRVDDAWRVGEPGAGWKVALSTLSAERLVLTGNAAVGRNLVKPLLKLATRIPGPDGRLLIEDGGFRARLATYYAAVAGIDRIGSRIATAAGRGQPIGPEATIGKATLTRLLQEMAIFGMECCGPSAAAIDPADDRELFALQEGFFLAPGYRMGGGTEEIAKNIIAERVLGLPPEHRPDKDVPFSDGVRRGNG